MIDPQFAESLKIHPARNGLAIYAGELPLTVIAEAASAERNETHPGYRFFNADGRLISYFTDQMLARFAQERTKNPPGTCPAELGTVMRLAQALQAAGIT